ncbi:hypothetical protein [Phenylobacterium sp.]|uniref:hypothetical protein n=1 Tax=Phenylobacterium sp. TaxID=1871053 RepID=UPI0035B409A4
MKTSQVDFAFPVIGFTTDEDIWGWPDLDRLTKCGSLTLKDRMQDGMEIIASDGRRWRVLSVTRTGRAEPLLSLRRLLGAPPQSRIEHELEALEPVTLKEVQARARASIKAHPDFWSEGEEGREAELRNRLADVDRVTAIGSLVDTLGLDTFESY